MKGLPLAPCTLAVLQSGTAGEVRDALITSLDFPQGTAVQWLRTNRPGVADQVLCLLNGFCWYQAGDFASPSDEEKWFIACLVDGPFDVSGTPLFDSSDALCAYVVKVFGLDEFFAATASPAGQFPREERHAGHLQ